MKALIDETRNRFGPLYFQGIKFESIDDFKKYSPQLQTMRLYLEHNMGLSAVYLERQMDNCCLSNVKIVDKKLVSVEEEVIDIVSPFLLPHVEKRREQRLEVIIGDNTGTMTAIFHPDHTKNFADVMYGEKEDRLDLIGFVAGFDNMRVNLVANNNHRERYKMDKLNYHGVETDITNWKRLIRYSKKIGASLEAPKPSAVA